jgi:hypothetical protein
MLRELLRLSAPGSLDRNPIRTWQLLCGIRIPSRTARSLTATATTRAWVTRQTSLLQTALLTLDRWHSTAFNARWSRPGHLRIVQDIRKLLRGIRPIRSLVQLIQRKPSTRSLEANPDIAPRGSIRTANRLTNNFFAQHDFHSRQSAWVRPRWPGFIAFQDAASAIVHRYLREPGIRRVIASPRRLQPRTHPPHQES